MSKAIGILMEERTRHRRVRDNTPNPYLYEIACAEITELNRAIRKLEAAEREEVSDG